MAEVGTHFNGSNNVARGNWIKNGYNAIHADSGIHRRVKVLLYSHYKDASAKDWRPRGSNFNEPGGNNDTIKARYGRFTTLSKYRPGNIFKR